MLNIEGGSKKEEEGMKKWRQRKKNAEINWEKKRGFSVLLEGGTKKEKEEQKREEVVGQNIYLLFFSRKLRSK